MARSSIDWLVIGQKTGSFLESRLTSQFLYLLFDKHLLSAYSSSDAINALRNGDLHELEKQLFCKKKRKRQSGGLEALVNRGTTLNNMLVEAHQTKQTKP